MKASIVIFFALIAVSAAWPVKPDDYKKFEQKAEEISQKDLEDYQVAVKAGDRQTQAKLVQDAIKVLEEAQANNQKLDKGMLPLMEFLNRMSHGSHLKVLRMAFLRFLSNLIDGNRDNKSYFLLQGVEKWAEKRPGEPEVAAAGQDAKEAKEHLDTMAGTFVKGIKAIKEETSHTFKEDEEKIRGITENIVATAKENSPLMIKKTEQAITELKNLLSRLQSGVNTRSFGDIIGGGMAAAMLG